MSPFVGLLIGHGPLHVLWCYPLRDAGYDLVHTVRINLLLVNREMKSGVKLVSLNFRRIAYGFVKRQREHVVLRKCAKGIASREQLSVWLCPSLQTLW